jgi:hypothetical protein
MADNEKTYKTTIDVETTNAAKNIDLLNKTVSTSLGEFENLNEAIGKTQDTLGKLDPKSAEFKELSKELQGLKDNLRDTEIQSVRFTEALAAQPGVIGFVGQSLEGLRGTFKVFMANPIIAVLAGIAGAFLALRESLTRTEEGQAKLTKITEGFTKILNGLFAIIEPIAMGLADLVIGLLENDKVMDGLSKTVGVVTGVFTTLLGTLQSVAGFIINTLVNNFQTLIGVAKGAGDVIAGVFTFDWDRVKEGANAAFDAVKEGVKGTVDNVKTLGNGIVDAAVSGFKAGEKQFKEGFSRLTETEKEAAEKAEEERKKRAEEQKKAVEEAQRVQTEAYISLLDARSAELFTREQKYQEDLKKLKAAGITDFTQLEEVYRRDVAEINKKYDDEAIAKQQEQIAKQKELLDGLTDYRLVEVELQFTRNEDAFNREIATINEREKMLVDAAKMAGDELLANESLTEEQRLQIINETNQRIADIEAQASSDRLSAQEQRYQNRLAVVTAEEQNLLNNINETERLLLENTQLTEDERTAIQLQAEQQRELLANEFQARRKEVLLAEDEDKLLRVESELSQLGLTFDRQRELIAEKEALLLEQEGLTEEQRTAIKRAAADERMAIDQMELDARAELQNAQLDLLADFGGFLKQIAGENKKLQIAAVIAEQVAAIGRIIVNTGIANAKAVAASPLTFGQPWVAINTATAAIGIASSVAAGVKAVRDIKNSDKGESASSGGGARLPRPAAPSVSGASIPQTVATGGEQNTGGQIAAAIAGARERETEKPIKAFVVSQDVSSTQAFDRRVNQAATFG